MANFIIKLINDETKAESFFIKNSMQGPITTDNINEASIQKDDQLLQHLVIQYFGQYTLERVVI